MKMSVTQETRYYQHPRTKMGASASESTYSLIILKQCDALKDLYDNITNEVVNKQQILSALNNSMHMIATNNVKRDKEFIELENKLKGIEDGCDRKNSKGNES